MNCHTAIDRLLEGDEDLKSILRACDFRPVDIAVEKLCKKHGLALGTCDSIPCWYHTSRPGRMRCRVLFVLKNTVPGHRNWGSEMTIIIKQFSHMDTSFPGKRFVLDRRVFGVFDKLIAELDSPGCSLLGLLEIMENGGYTF